MNNTITHRQVMDRAGNRIELPPMAAYCEPSQRAIIRARDAQSGQRLERNRNEAMALLRVLEPEPRRSRPAAEPDYETKPLLTAEFIAGLIAGAMILGSRL